MESLKVKVKVKVIIRPFRPEDAGVVSALIRAALVEVNSKDYEPSVIEYMYGAYTPEKMLEIAGARLVLVAVAQGVAVGTASLENNYVGSVFVDPRWHRQGIGTRLMVEIERLAQERGVPQIHLGASLSAVEFYDTLGYTRGAKVQTEKYGPVVEMTKSLQT
jgi:GNAT superfamily N-acetyltransferase